MTTRSGRTYRRASPENISMTESESVDTASSAGDMVKVLMADRERREEQMQRLMNLLEASVGRDRTASPAAAPTTVTVTEKVKVAKLTDQDDIEAYLTTFERLMEAYSVERRKWACQLAPQLSGRAQKAYAALPSAEANDYEQLKKAILKRYDINEETYRQRFRSTRKKSDESHRELVVRLQDLRQKWMQKYSTVEQIGDIIVMEQFLNSLTPDLRVWIRERKPETTSEAGELADQYEQARKSTLGVGSGNSKEGVQRRDHKKDATRSETRRCHACGREGHLARNCSIRRDGESQPKENRLKEPVIPKKEKGDRVVKCYNCGKTGHIATNCPSNALFCSNSAEDWSTQSGVIEGTAVPDIVLDTGCSRTMVRQDLVAEEKLLEGEAVTIRCAHGDMDLYPLAKVEMELNGTRIETIAAVSDHLHVSALLGTDVPELIQLLGTAAKNSNIGKIEEAMVITRAQARRKEDEEATQRSKEEESGVQANPLIEQTREEITDCPDQPSVGSEGEMLGSNLSDDLFHPGRSREKKTRREKRQERHKHGLVRAKDQPRRQASLNNPDKVTKDDLQRMQKEDPTLAVVREMANETTTPQVNSFYWEDGLMYRKWQPRGQEKEEVDQIILPKECRQKVLELAHAIPLAGHLGKKKTTERITRRFYWPTLHRDIADYCRSCETCQKFRRQQPPQAPMIPLPIVDEPFARIAMDIVGPLPRSRAGNRYVLVICDYATRYPEAVALKSIDAENVAEELVKLFSRVGIPREILTDQGSNFTSKLLAEMYCLLHIKALRTSPYHPQCDGLVERFNKTLKEMLRKTAKEEGKDWDKLLPYILFAYREVPQESTGFSPFELLYGREVRGPLDVLKETWETPEKSDENVLSYITMMREKLQSMMDHVQDNLRVANHNQKTWYDKNSRQRTFQQGDQVLVLLPTSSSKLLAQWQGPYEIIKPVGKVNYQVQMHDRRKKTRILHVNMLRRWHTPSSPNYLTKEIHHGNSEEMADDIPSWNDDKEEGRPKLGEQLQESQKEELSELLLKFKLGFGVQPGYTDLAEHKIEAGDAKPVRLPPYRLPQAYQEMVRKELTEMLECGIIEPSTSSWASPIVPVKKKDNTIRLCVDYRRLNSVSTMDAYPMPRVDDMIDQIGGAKFISTLDLTKGYWQVPVAEKDREKTAFSTPFGLFQFTRMPFGLQGAPATFQRMVDRLLNGLGDFANAYIDDVIIYSKTWKEHLNHLEIVLDRLVQAGLKAKPTKCQLGMAECVYLGHVIGGGKVQPERAKIQAISDFTPPTTKKGVRSFLGITGYYRKFIPHYATIATPLTDLTRKSQPNKVVWTPDCAESFQKLKNALCSVPILQSPNFDEKFILQTDASDRGIGAVLSQLDEDGMDHPVSYFSRKLLPREEKYATIEKECLAIKLGIHAFRTYLTGRYFSIQTDHRALEWLDRIKDSNARLTRWSLFLQSYNFHIEYRPGKRNANADALSRSP